MKNKILTIPDINITIHDRLVKVARARETISYNDIGNIINLRGRSRQLFQILDDINRYEHYLGHPMLTAVVISVIKNLPGRGFFNLAHELGVYQGSSDLLFWVNKLQKVHYFWSLP